MTLTPQERSLRARIGAYALHAKHDPKETTSNARAAFLARFEQEVDPEGKLPPEERQRRAHYARKAHFAKLALQSARARRQGKQSKPQTQLQSRNDETAGGTAVQSLEVRDDASQPSS